MGEIEAFRKPEGLVSPETLNFRNVCIRRLDELVADGSLPEKFARKRMEDAMLVELGPEDRDPEASATLFAETGMNEIDRFRKIVDEVEGEVREIVESVLEKVDAVRERLQEIKQQGKVVPIDISEKMRLAEDTVINVQDAFEQFAQRAKDIRQLRVGMTDLAGSKSGVVLGISRLESLLDEIDVYKGGDV